MGTEKKALDALVQSGQAWSAKEASELSAREKKEAAKIIKKLNDSGQMESPRGVITRSNNGEELTGWREYC